MKILQVINNLNAEGAQTLLVDLCLRWKRSGLGPEVFVLRDGDPTYQARLEDSGIRVTVSRQTRLYSPGYVKEIASIISGKRFDLVHVHLYPAQLWSAMALRANRDAPPGITTEHNTWNRRRDHHLCKPVDRWMYSQFQLAVCIGATTRQSLEDWVGPGTCPTRVIANGIDFSRFHEHNVPAQLPDSVKGAPTILCVGSLTDRKDQATLIRAIAEIEGVHVLLAGEGPLRQDVEHVARKLHVDGRVHFLGTRHDIPGLIAAADIYAQPSIVDGFCIAALEAMAGGLPVIASDVPGLGELVGTCGLLFPAGDHRRLAECIRRLLVDSALARDLAARGVDRAQQFSIDRTATEYQEIFEMAVNGAVLAD